MGRYPTRHFRILRGGLLREREDSVYLTYGGHEILREGIEDSYTG
jgi:hypothetical protein